MAWLIVVAYVVVALVGTRRAFVLYDKHSKARSRESDITLAIVTGLWWPIALVIAAIWGIGKILFRPTKREKAVLEKRERTLAYFTALGQLTKADMKAQGPSVEALLEDWQYKLMRHERYDYDHPKLMKKFQDAVV